MPIPADTTHPRSASPPIPHTQGGVPRGLITASSPDQKPRQPRGRGRAKSPAPRSKSPAPRSKSPAPRSKSPAARRSKSPAARRSPSPAARRTPRAIKEKAFNMLKGSSATKKDGAYDAGTNWVEGGVGQGSLFMPMLMIFGPLAMQWLAYLTSPEANPSVEGGSPPTHFVGDMLQTCRADLPACGNTLLHAATSATPTLKAVQFLGAFNLLALVLDVFLPGKTCFGPETLTGHVPAYVDNAVLHCIVFTVLFVGGSNLGASLPAFKGTSPMPYDLTVKTMGWYDCCVCLWVWCACKLLRVVAR